MASESSSSITGSSPSFVNQYFRWVPLLTPAVKLNGFEVDDKLISIRTSIVTIAMSVLSYPKWSPFDTFLSKLTHRLIHINADLYIVVRVTMVVCVILLPGLLLKMAELYKAQKVADENAVNAYLSNENPPEAAIRHIANHLSAARRLLSQPGVDLNKHPELGYGLISQHHMNIDVFKLLVDRGCDFLRRGSLAESGFINAVMSDNPEYLRYLVQSHRISPDELNGIRSTMSNVTWSRIKHREIVDLLLELGLDINNIDLGPNGRTPLGWLLFEQESGLPEIVQPPQLTRDELIALLREKGAVE
jgi:hypothetical protein